MGDMLTTGASGLLAFQQALSTVSHNIANVNTPGYSRQSANLVTNPAFPTGSGWIGTGVSVSSIDRSYDSFLAAQTLSASSSYNQLNTMSGLAGTVSNLFGDTTSGLPATLQKFGQAVQTMASSPAQTASRQALLSQAQSLISTFKNYDSSLGQLAGQVDTQLGTEAAAVSTLAQNIANLNQKIVAAKSQTQQAPNDLLDQRDQMISQLAAHLSITTLTQGDGTVSVYVGSGQTLVLGTQAATLTTAPDKFNSGPARLLLQTAAGSTDVTDVVGGGTVGGLLQFREQMLTPARNNLGQAAVTLTNLVNAQNAVGLDQRGAVGTALLAVGAPQALGATTNSGAETVTAAVTDLGGLTSSDYYLRYNGSTWSLTDVASGAATALTVSGGGASTTLSGAGLTLTVNGSAQAGDEFLVQPTRQAVAGLTLLTADPTRIAAAAPLLTSAASTNTGNASIDGGTVPVTAAWVRGNYTLSFTGAASYSISDASGTTVASGSYTSGAPIAFNGIAVTVSGTPARGDSFSINDNANGSGDNRNALLLAGVLGRKVLGGGQQSLVDSVAAYVGTVGLQTGQVQSGATAQQSVLQSAQAAQASVAGVNLDEEAARMLKFEQAYQAAAQVIKVAGTLFQSLLNAV
jgi:flagellar hook-associated protein 1 FlgK